MKRYFLDLLFAVPLALGFVLTIFCVSNALGSPDDSDKGFVALVSGLIGIPLLFASSAAILRRGTRAIAEGSEA
ncbi:MAG: hypothetical protein Q7T94_02730 [Rugosibacter sp.]|nr:hypothetical protein [Rugosibacter sp.]